MRHLEYAEPNLSGARMILMESDGTEVARYQCERSFRRIERYGRWFRINGRDRETGETIYLPEIEPLDEHDLLVLDEDMINSQTDALEALQRMTDQAEELGLYDD